MQKLFEIWNIILAERNREAENTPTRAMLWFVKPIWLSVEPYGGGNQIMRVEFLNFNVALKYRDGQQLRQLCRCYLVINTTHCSCQCSPQDDAYQIVKLLHSSAKFTSKWTLGMSVKLQLNQQMKWFITLNSIGKMFTWTVGFKLVFSI